ncbi:hypothetical protein [Bacillus sp. AFS023182]|uniref:hypothetical protein n=1 Tax=Bacillus sp. AFS023182 TaxID=2033492 RepID=UPI001596E8C8|nr:hypothetical protein [Bacillus sp. AFS023182]
MDHIIANSSFDLKIYYVLLQIASLLTLKKIVLIEEKKKQLILQIQKEKKIPSNPYKL